MRDCHATHAAAVAFAAAAALAFSLVASVGGAGLNTAVCTPFTDNGGRDFPDIPNTFVAKYLFFSRVENASLYMEEYFSQQANEGVLFITDLHRAGATTQLITLGTTGELITVRDTRDVYNPDNCGVESLNGADQTTFPFKPNTAINGTVKDTLMSGRTVLMFGVSDGLLRYNGTSKHGGIDLDVWIGCLYDSTTDLTLLTTFYFARNDSKEQWSTASGVQSIKRLDVVGTDSQNVSRTDITYDYVLFDTRIRKSEWEWMLEPPEGSVCKGRASVKSLPKMPTFFSFQAEILDPFNKIITYTDEWYDYWGNYSRMDFVNYRMDDPTTASQVISVVNDFTTGVSYQIDRDGGSCVVSVIAPDEFDSVVVGSNLTRMRSPQEFFNFDGDDYPWTYNGRRRVRDIDANVWVSYRPYPTRQSSMMAVWEWYFSADKWKLVDKDLVEINEPLRLVVTGDDNIKEIYNIYRFSEDMPSTFVFDASQCFDADAQSRSFELLVNADVRKYNIDSNMELLTYFAVMSLESGAGIRPLRVQDLEFEFADKAFALRFSILGPAPVAGDVNTGYRDPPLDESVDRLKQFIQSSGFVIPWVTDDNKNVFFTADPNSLIEIGRSNGGNDVLYIDDNNGSSLSSIILSPGGAAAVAICMLIVGALLVGVPYWIVKRRRK